MVGKTDTFYSVTIPARIKRDICGASYSEWVGGLFTGHYEQRQCPITFSEVPEKIIYFDTKKQAKRYCLEHGLSTSLISRVEV